MLTVLTAVGASILVNKALDKAVDVLMKDSDPEDKKTVKNAVMFAKGAISVLSGATIASTDKLVDFGYNSATDMFLS